MQMLIRSLAVLLCFVGAPVAQSKVVTEKKQPADGLVGAPFVNATAWAIADAKTGQFLYGLNEQKAMPMASITKIMTALLVMKVSTASAGALSETVKVSRFAGNTGGSSARLRPGDEVKVSDLLYGLLLPSGNDAANALAEHFGKRFENPKDIRSIPWNVRSAGRSPAWMNFVAEMNREAKRLKLVSTRFVNPHGLDTQYHYSTARDLLVLAKAVMAHAEIRRRVATREFRAMIVTASGSRRTESWKNTNRLLVIEGYRGVKTGTTSKAGACLVSNAVRGENSLFIVVLNSNNRQGRYVDTRNLFRWAFSQRLAGGK
jgi:D-alanyl-D-alanine carboxypeptidase (penicillin-binding protein 5/6)